ncbi:hypothetical protein [Microvirga yunnanensis]|uniref:hypothetical protein n=1 Tax=Microvirga yunnanensis TaxID=2953740 RepID=UPI0021CA6668|nr:hypothetical protein [Microvirga sp. HBU67655]
MNVRDLADWSDDELRIWRKELQRILFAGVLQTSSINGISMTFVSRADLEARITLISRTLDHRAGIKPDPVFQVLTVIPRRGF